MEKESQYLAAMRRDLEKVGRVGVPADLKDLVCEYLMEERVDFECITWGAIYLIKAIDVSSV